MQAVEHPLLEATVSNYRGRKKPDARGNEVHRFRDRQAATFVGRTVHADSPSGQFPDATLLDRRKLRGIVAHGKHLGYDFGRNLILHVHLGRFGDFTEGKLPLAEPKGRSACGSGPRAQDRTTGWSCAGLRIALSTTRRSGTS